MVETFTTETMEYPEPKGDALRSKV